MSHELVVDLDTPDKACDGTDGICQFRAGVEVARDHRRGVIDTRQAVAALGERRGNGGEGEHRRKQKLSFGHRL